MKNNSAHPSTTSSHIRKTLVTALLLAGIGQADIVHAATVNNGDVLTINAGVTGGNYGFVTGGSYFAWDTNQNNIFSQSERRELEQGTEGIIIGITQVHYGTTFNPYSSSSSGSTEGGTIDAMWRFFAGTGLHFTAGTPITGSTTTGLVMSGWRMSWGGIPEINMGGGIQDCGTSTDGVCVDLFTSSDIAGTYDNGTGIAMFAWSGVYGTGYTLDYFAIFPQADPSDYGGLLYQLHLEGNVVSAVPVPAAVWLFGSGMAGLLAMSRRRRRL